MQAGKVTRLNWLLDLCKQHVEKFVLQAEVSLLVRLTDEHDKSTNEPLPCQLPGCNRKYVSTHAELGNKIIVYVVLHCKIMVCFC